MKLFYRTYGEGPPLIILHGLYGSSDNWVSIARKLADKFYVILPDLRNHGQSPHSPVHTYETMRNDVHELFVDLNLRKCFLAGHSMGGKVAAAFALKWPELLNGLLIADISPFSDAGDRTGEFEQHLTILRTILSIDTSAISSRAEAEQLLLEKISSERTAGLIMKNLQRETNGTYSWKLNALALYNNLENIMSAIRPANDTVLPVTGFPVSVLKGGLSNYIQPAGFGSIRAVFPAAELSVIRCAGHWVHADQPEEVISALTGFLED
jgi:esterase